MPDKNTHVIELLQRIISEHPFLNSTLDDIDYFKGRMLNFRTEFESFENECTNLMKKFKNKRAYDDIGNLVIDNFEKYEKISMKIEELSVDNMDFVYLIVKNWKKFCGKLSTGKLEKKVLPRVCQSSLKFARDQRRSLDRLQGYLSHEIRVRRFFIKALNMETPKEDGITINPKDKTVSFDKSYDVGYDSSNNFDYQVEQKKNKLALLFSKNKKDEFADIEEEMQNAFDELKEHEQTIIVPNEKEGDKFRQYFFTNQMIRLCIKDETIIETYENGKEIKESKTKIPCMRKGIFKKLKEKIQDLYKGNEEYMKEQLEESINEVRKSCSVKN